MTKYATGYPASGALTGAETLQVVRAGADLQAAVSDIWAGSAPGANYLINGDLFINQRLFAGGALAAGVYGYDRWKAGTGGANVSVNTTTYLVTHNSGPLVQVIETPGLAGQVVTVSVEDPSGSISVSVDGVTGSITAGAGRRGVTLTVPSGSTGNVTLTLTATSVTYKRVKLERGGLTPWSATPMPLIVSSCQRYYEKSFDLTQAPTTGIAGANYVASAYSTSLVYSNQIPFQVAKRSSPTMSAFTSSAAGTQAAGAMSLYNGSAYVNATANMLANQRGFGVQMNFGSGLTFGFAYRIDGNWVAESEL